MNSELNGTQKIIVNHPSWAQSSLNRQAVVRLLADLFPQQAKIVDVDDVSQVDLFDEDCDVFLFFIDIAGDWHSLLAKLDKIKQDKPQTVRLLVVDKAEAEFLKKIINQGHVSGIYEQADFFKRAVEILQNAMNSSRMQRQKILLRKQLTKQMRELESLNVGLENIVHERTLHIENSKIEEEQRLNQVRGLIRLIKDLALINSFDDLLPILRKELRKFSKLGEPFLLLQSEKKDLEVLSLQAGQIHFAHFALDFDFSSDFKFLEQDTLRSFANHFGRPLIKTLYVPLSRAQSQSAFAVEVSMTENEIATLIDFLRERLQPLALTAERLLLERELLNSSYLWEKTFDGFRDPIVILDSDFAVLRANKKFSSKEEKPIRLGHRCYKEFAGIEQICEGCPAEKAFESSSSHTSTVKIGERTFEVHSYPIQLGLSRTTNVVNQYVDITQKRDLYLRMLQSEKLEAMGLLAGNIAHELNNPLTGLRSLAQVLQAELQSSSGKEQLTADLLEIEKAALRSQQIIKNLLEFSQGGSVPRKEIALDEIVQRTLPLLKSVMRTHRQNIHLETENHKILVEPHLLQQVVFNLINNACQAMKTPGTITVETELVLDSLGQAQAVRLLVQDTGPGIADSLREKIFEPFFTTKKEGVGTGLGLSLAKKIIEAHAGKIYLKTDLPSGACFVVELPISHGENK